MTLDELVLPYRLARWQVQFEYRPGILQDLIPVFPFTRRQASFEDQITPSCSEADARDNFANHLHQLASRVIGVKRRYDFGPCR